MLLEFIIVVVLFTHKQKVESNSKKRPMALNFFFQIKICTKIHRKREKKKNDERNDKFPTKYSRVCSVWRRRLRWSNDAYTLHTRTILILVLVHSLFSPRVYSCVHVLCVCVYEWPKNKIRRHFLRVDTYVHCTA